MKRYPATAYFVFVDNVCDTFAEHFVDEVLRSGVEIRFFMKLRAHHPHKFWAKLAAAGLEACQLGVKSMSGLIANHPAATRADLDETRRVLRSNCQAHMRSYSERALTVSQRRLRDGSLEITDGCPDGKKFVLKGMSARIYEVCHDGLKLEFIEEALQVPRADIEKELVSLVRDRLVLHADDHHLSMALRSRAEALAHAGFAKGLRAAIPLRSSGPSKRQSR